MEKTVTTMIKVGLDTKNNNIRIFDNYNIKHTKAYLEIIKEVINTLKDDHDLSLFKVTLNDRNFKSIEDFADKNQEDLKKEITKQGTKLTKAKKAKITTAKMEDFVDIDPDIEKRFTYHKPTADKTREFETLRDLAKIYAMLIKSVCPEGREQSLALTKLEEAVMWANAGIARSE